MGFETRPLREFFLKDLTYEMYCKLAVAQEPFAIVDAASSWPDSCRWSDLSHFTEHPAVNADEEEAEMTLHPGPFNLKGDSGEISLSEGLQMLMAAEGQGGGDIAPDHPLYLKWGFGHVPKLVEEMPVHKFFAAGVDSTPADNPMLIRPGRFFCWLYAGQCGSGSATHIDVLSSAAWLTLLRGRKDWLLAPGGELQKLTLPGGERAPLFDLVEEWGERGSWQQQLPNAGEAVIYSYTQRPGTAIFVPSEALHSVRNKEFGVSVTHNFVDKPAQPHWEACIKSMLGAS